MAATAEASNNTNGGGVTVVGPDAPLGFHIAPRSDNPNPNPSQESASPPQPPVRAAASRPPYASQLRKKRGRPRKYGPDGATVALSPKPISSAAGAAAPSSSVIDFSGRKRGRAKAPSSLSKTNYEIPNLGESFASLVGTDFTPHIITVNAGEDVTMKIISFSQCGPQAVCILSANGVISSVTLRQPDSYGGTLTYEGCFEILSLSGSFTPHESEGTRSLTGGMSVSLAGSDGRVIGGGVAGLLVAASPVQVVVGSFLPENQLDQKSKKPKHEFLSAAAPAMAALPISVSGPNPRETGFLLPSDSRNRTSDINIPISG